MASSSSDGLAALETAILSTIDTLDRLDDFAEPGPNPDNPGLAHNLNELVRGLDGVRAAGAKVPLALPAELVAAYVDAGKSPDAFTAELHARAARSSDAVSAKQRGVDHLAEAIRAQAGDLLSAVKEEPGSPVFPWEQQSSS